MKKKFPLRTSKLFFRSLQSTGPAIRIHSILSNTTSPELVIKGSTNAVNARLNKKQSTKEKATIITGLL